MARIPASEPTAVRLPQQRQKRLRHREEADDVDLEELPRLGDRHQLQRSTEPDAGVVHQPVEPPVG
jgi:hypothetical protein